MSCPSIEQVLMILMNYIKNKIQKTNAFECNNNDFFPEIDPGLNFINHANKNYSYYTIK